MQYPALDRLGQLVRDLDGLKLRMTSQMDSLAAENMEATSDSGLIRVTSTPRGRITGLAIDPRAMRLGSQTLGEEILQAIDHAQQLADDRVRDMAKTMLNPGENK